MRTTRERVIRLAREAEVLAGGGRSRSRAMKNARRDLQGSSRGLAEKYNLASAMARDLAKRPDVVEAVDAWRAQNGDLASGSPLVQGFIRDALYNPERLTTADRRLLGPSR